MKEILMRLFGKGTDVAGKVGGLVDRFVRTKDEKAEFEKEMTNSKIADTRNLGAGRYGGANTAAAFLKQFVPQRGEGDDAEDIPWAHMDIAGNYWGAKTNKMVNHGATGVHVRTLVKFITGE